MTRRNRLLAYVTRRQCARRNRNLLSSLVKTQENNNNSNYYHRECNRDLLSSSCITRTQPWTEHSLFLSPPLIPVSGLFQPEGALCKLLPLEHTYGAPHYHHNELLSNSRVVLSSMHSVSSRELNTFILATIGLMDDIASNTCKGAHAVNLPRCNDNNIDEYMPNDKTQRDVPVCVDEKANVFTSPSPNATSSSSSASPVLHMQRRFIAKSNNSNNNNNNNNSACHSNESEQTESANINKMNENNHTEEKEINEREESSVAEEVSLPDVYAIISSCKLLNLVSANGEARLDWELPELKAKYRDLAQHYHPDLMDGCAVSMEQINNAYAVLRHMSLMQKRELASAMRFGESYVLSRYDTSNDFNNTTNYGNDDRSREKNEIDSTSNDDKVTQEQEVKSVGMFSKCRLGWFASHKLVNFFPWSSTLSTVSKSKTHTIKNHPPISPELLSDDMLALMAAGLYSTLLTLLWCVYYFYYHHEQWQRVKRAFTSWVSAQSGNDYENDCSIDYANNNTNHNVNDDVVEDGMNNNPESCDVHSVQETMHTSQTAKQNDKDHNYNYYYHYFVCGGKTNCTDNESAQNERENDKHMHQTSSSTKAKASSPSSSSSSSSRLQRNPNKTSTRQTNVSSKDSRVVNDINAEVDILMAVQMLIYACQRS